MKSFSLFAIALTMALSLGLAAGDAEAKRLGGGRSIGMQRQMNAPAPKAPPTAAPVQQAAPTAPAAAVPQTQPKRSWMGPLAGLAAGLGLAALASHFGFGEELASLMLMALLAFVVIAAVGFFMRRRMEAPRPALAGMPGMQYSAERVEPVNHSLGSTDGGTASRAAAIPAGFDVAGFVRNAKVHYLRLQAANDAADLDDIRSFTTPEMFAEIKMEIDERGGAAQETDVIALEAEVLEVIEEANRYVASVRFTGQIREDKGPITPVDEIWHLVKPRDGSGGWVLAGIQQLQ